jgi:hypothetical protein
VQHDLGVALRAEHVTAIPQARAQLAVVVDLAVGRDGDVAGLVQDGLVAAGQVDDRQSPEGHAQGPGHVHAIIVRTAMRHGARRAQHLGRGRRASTVVEPHTEQTAHGPLP